MKDCNAKAFSTILLCLCLYSYDIMCLNINHCFYDGEMCADPYNLQFLSLQAHPGGQFNMFCSSQ